MLTHTVCDACSHQDGVPPRPYADVAEIIEASVGATMDDLFESFDPTPLGAASIAQAHRATLRDGREVVVKVRPCRSPRAPAPDRAYR